MALFGRKTVNCAICGKEAKTGLLRGLFQQEIEGQFVCKECFGDVDLPIAVSTNMTLDQFRGYMVFREENNKLKQMFQITEMVDLGVLEEKVCFDAIHGLLSLDKELNFTVFERKHIREFVIKEDEYVLLRGSASGLRREESPVRREVMHLDPMIRAYRVAMKRYLDTPEDQRAQMSKPEPSFDMTPVNRFRVEIYFDHPYWDRKTLEVSVPSFDSTRPDVHDYLRAYDRAFAPMEQLANAMMAFAFAEERTGAAAEDPGADTVTELMRYKELLDMGIITEAEFTTKKRQLMGI